MITIRELINKIIWDQSYKNCKFTLWSHDRITKELFPIKYNEIARIEEVDIILYENGEEKIIPLHRIRKVEKDGKIIWERNAK